MTRARKFLPRLLGAAGLTAGLVAAVTAFSGAGYAGSAAQTEYAPQNTAAPTISGAAQEGQTLTATTGTWNSASTPTYAYSWQRCSSTGTNCADISGATGSTYKVTSTDVGNTLRVNVTATNTSGTSTASSGTTPVVTAAGPAGAVKLANGLTSIPASSVALPERLIISGVKFTPSRLSSRNAFTAQFRVTDTRGYVVRDALVYALGLPYSWARTSGEVRTGQDGWATITMNPTRNLPLRRGSALVVFVRARVEGQDLLAGTSTRRLAQVTIR